MAVMDIIVKTALKKKVLRAMILKIPKKNKHLIITTLKPSNIPIILILLKKRLKIKNSE